MIRGTLMLVVVGTLRVWLADPVKKPVLAEAADDLPALLAESTREATDTDERARQLAPNEKLDPNRASAVQLDRLPGVGPSLAQAIVDHREREGPFSQPADLLAVRGLGKVSLARVESLLDFSTGPPRALRRSRTGPRVPGETRVPINSAEVDDLVLLPGIGPVIAQRILDRRRDGGPFSAVEDLLDVPGIGPRTLERIRARVRVDGRLP
jgi:competence protein ComEA